MDAHTVNPDAGHLVLEITAPVDTALRLKTDVAVFGGGSFDVG